MTDINSALDRYIAVWNETDPARRRAEIESLWITDAIYANGASEYRGHDEIAAGVTRSHDAWVGTGHRFEAAGIADSHHNTGRFVWHMYGPDGSAEPVSIGTNFIRLNDDGEIVSDVQFIDR